jgi:hypothetical protein
MKLRRWMLGAFVGTLVGCSEAPPPEEPSAPGPEELIPGRPDFEFATVKGPAELSPRASGPLRALLCNRGDTDGSTEVSFYFSYNSTFEQFDKWVATTDPIFVPAGGCQDVSELVARPNVPDASYHLIAVADVDMWVSEGREGNNARVGVGKFTVDFHAPPRPVLKWVPGEDPTGSPFLEVTSEINDFVYVYSGERCEGAPVAESRVGSQLFCYMPIDLSGTPSSSYSVKVVDFVGNASACSTIGAPIGYGTPPCEQGYSDCDGNPANGCEVNLTEDADHCGACGTSCQYQGNAAGVCISGTCGVACPVGTYDCDGNPVNGCESSTACSPAVCTVDSAEELIITSLSVVEDPVRTAPGGAWHFGTLMRAMAGNQDPSTLVRQWLRTWNTTQQVNGLTLPARSQMLTKVLGPWEQRSGGASRPLDFSKAPFRLLAIVNRMDLRNPGVQAGEGRFVFGVLDAAGNPLEFTVILEYALPGGTPEAIQAWARDWHELGQLGLGHPNYKVKLQALTDRFTRAGVMASRPHGNALNQLRTNEVALSSEWEMREFVLTSTALQPATVKRTPDLGFENTGALRDFIQANQADVLAERHTVPESLNGARFLAARAPVPEAFFWRVPGVPSEARHKFSLNTCSGCHSRETGTEFTHIAPRAAGQVAALSAYLMGGTLPDPVTAVSRSFNDLDRRAEDLKALVCGTPPALSLTGESFGGFPAASNLPPARVH